MRIDKRLAATLTALLAASAGPLAAQTPAVQGLESQAPAAMVAEPPPIATAQTAVEAPAPTAFTPAPSSLTSSSSTPSSPSQADPTAAAPKTPADSPPLGATAPASGPPPPRVQSQPLAQLDLFSTGRNTGLGADLWKGSSADIAHAVLPTLGRGPLSPAATGLALRLLGQAATAPDGAGSDADLAAARVHALLALGDAATADSISDRTANLASDAGLSQVAAEAALITDQNAKACAIGDAVAVQRDQVYWLRLRAFCQALAGKPDAALLTLTLASQQGPDPVYARLMGAVIANAGDPGAPSLRNGLDYALSRQLKLNLDVALPQASPAIAAHLAASAPPVAVSAADSSAVPPPPPPPSSEAELLADLRKAVTPAAFVAAAKAAAPGIDLLVQTKAVLANPVQLATAAIVAGDLANAQAIRAALPSDAVSGALPLDLSILDALLAVAVDKPDTTILARLAERGAKADGKERARAQAAAALFAALGGPSDGTSRAELAGFELGKSAAPSARLLALNAAADATLRGETGLLALWVAEPGGGDGPKTPDRAAIIRALNHAGLAPDALAFAIEGLVALQVR